MDSYVRRLAHANHLRPSYLHAYLCGPPAWLGAVDLERLAILCGRPAAVLRRTLTEPAPDPTPAPKPRPAKAPSARHPRSARTTSTPTSSPTGQPSNPTEHKTEQRKKLEKRIELFAAIRRDAQSLGASIRALARQHHVHRRTILQALDSPIPPPRKPLSPRKTQVDPHKEFIDAILLEDRTRPPNQRHTIRRIWERLVDEHDAQVSYGMIRAYIARRRHQLDTDAD